MKILLRLTKQLYMGKNQMTRILQYFRQSYSYYLAYYVGFFKHAW
jgi:hypothetical protein